SGVGVTSIDAKDRHAADRQFIPEPDCQRASLQPHSHEFWRFDRQIVGDRVRAGRHLLLGEDTSGLIDDADRCRLLGDVQGGKAWHDGSPSFVGRADRCWMTSLEEPPRFWRELPPAITLSGPR